jgi:PAS domain S-box-containing protein
LVTSAIRDITERKLVEESRFRLAAIVESSEDAIISKSLDAVIVSWNAGAQHTFGYTEQEAVGRPITILIPSELREEENKILERLRVGECINHYETVRVTKAGNKINVSLSISPIKDSTCPFGKAAYSPRSMGI